jgi:DNA repair exonuclease SbcCD nuclease subunit
MNIPTKTDTHPGLSAFNRLNLESGMNLREKQIYDNFLSAVDKIIEAEPDVLVRAGDLFDTVKPKTREYVNSALISDKRARERITTCFSGYQ